MVRATDVFGRALILRAYGMRGLLLWSLTRATGTFFFYLAATSPRQISIESRVHFVLFAVAVCFVDSWVRRERALLANLGVSVAFLAMIFATAAIIGELMLLLAFGTAR
jgi:hypothetical protein